MVGGVDDGYRDVVAMLEDSQLLKPFDSFQRCGRQRGKAQQEVASVDVHADVLERWCVGRGVAAVGVPSVPSCRPRGRAYALGAPVEVDIR